MADSPSIEPTRAILHVDMDAFYASVAQLDDPSLRGRPVIVGGQSARRGVVSAASYEARAFGVRSAMPIYQALERCPHAVLVPGDFDRYREIHRTLREVWARYAPAVEVASFDEAYLDITGCEAVIGTPETAARALQAEILAETGLTCSVGAGTSKLVAKVASKVNKPRGLCVVPPGTEASFLAPMRIRELHGIGPKTTARLAEVGLTHVHHLTAMPEGELERFLGPLGAQLRQMALGLDRRAVEPSSPAKSIGAETTFETDVTDPKRLKAVYHDLVQEVAFRLRRTGLFARTITVKIRYHDWETITRARTLSQASDDDRVIAEAALGLFQAHAEPGRPVRLVGVSLSNLTGVAQLSLLAGPEDGDRRALNAALDDLRKRHGLWVVSRGTHLEGSSRRR